ncbi:MAG: alpha/beta hydrolase, partial [Bacteroidales bacterium]|nr:alpha/beta hydrolase [Bacteroidales bacterium]
MKRIFLSVILLLAVLSTGAADRENIWPKGKMPDAQDHQIAAMTDESKAEGFNPDKHRMPYIEWLDA